MARVVRAYLFICLILPTAALSQGVSRGKQIPGMSLIPASPFWMGRAVVFLFDDLDWTARDRLDDQPVHRVYLDAFYMDQYEVTQSDYGKFAEATGHKTPWDWKDGKIRPGREKWPMYNVSWFDADAYCKWAGKRLPTEAEWEKAGRGGLDRNLYPWGNELTDGVDANAGGARGTPAKKKAHYAEPSPTNVGSYPPNGYGLYDVIGNVWEWVADWYARDYYSISPNENPKGPETGKYKVVRGAGFSSNEAIINERSMVGVHYRNYAEPALITTYGFRCAKSVDETAPAPRQ
jgi:formylglycine-generating enzyme required for sulfatase activity